MSDEPTYRLLQIDEIIRAEDEFSRDGAVWHKVTNAMIGMKVRPHYATMRRLEHADFIAVSADFIAGFEAGLEAAAALIERAAPLYWLDREPATQHICAAIRRVKVED